MKPSRKKRSLDKLLPLALAGSLTLVVACGSDNDDDDPIPQAENPPQEAEDWQGSYRAILLPVNPTVSPNVSGTALVSREGDNFRVRVSVDNAPQAIHMQHIHTGTACPVAAADVNGDGFIDVIEAQASVGNVLIPLNGDLSSQSAGSQYWPFGNYNYDRSTSYDLMLADLRAPDENPDDSVVKLGPEENLNLEGRVVEIHGVAQNANLPETVASKDGMPAHRTLPIACGVLTRVEAEPLPGTGSAGTPNGEQQGENQGQDGAADQPGAQGTEGQTQPQG
jgi:hypothetical protein